MLSNPIALAGILWITLVILTWRWLGRVGHERFVRAQQRIGDPGNDPPQAPLLLRIVELIGITFVLGSILIWAWIGITGPGLEDGSWNCGPRGIYC